MAADDATRQALIQSIAAFLGRHDAEIMQAIRRAVQSALSHTNAGSQTDAPKALQAATEPPSVSTTRTLLLQLSPEAYTQLEDLAHRKQKPISETIRDALALETWVQDVRDAGDHVLFEHKGKLRELRKV